METQFTYTWASQKDTSDDDVGNMILYLITNTETVLNTTKLVFCAISIVHHFTVCAFSMQVPPKHFSDPYKHFWRVPQNESNL